MLVTSSLNEVEDPGTTGIGSDGYVTDKSDELAAALVAEAVSANPVPASTRRQPSRRRTSRPATLTWIGMDSPPSLSRSVIGRGDVGDRVGVRAGRNRVVDAHLVGESQAVWACTGRSGRCEEVRRRTRVSDPLATLEARSESG